MSNIESKIGIFFVILCVFFSGCLSEFSGDYTDNLSYKHKKVTISDTHKSCWGDDGYCHEILFDLTNDNTAWTFFSGDGKWTVLTNYQNTYNNDNVFDSCDIPPGETCANWDLAFPVSQNERITKLMWDFDDLHFEVEMPPY